MDPAKFSEYKFVEGKPNTFAFFEKKATSFTVTYVVIDFPSKKCAVIDPVTNFNLASGVATYDSADKILKFIKDNGLECVLILDTHVHADHLTAAGYMKEKLGVKYGIGFHVTTVQETFSKVFNLNDVPTNGSQFDMLFNEGDKFEIGSIKCSVLHTPGHTPACLSYVIGDSVFCGDTIFMPDMGSARCDFPGGSATTLYNSIQKILSLPEEYKIYVGHDYAPGGRDYGWETTVKEQKEKNKHTKTGTTVDEFVAFREKRDAELGVPELLYPSIQVNMRGGNFPTPESNGSTYVKLPITDKKN